MDERQKRVRSFFENKNIDFVEYRTYKLYKNPNERKIKVRAITDDSNCNNGDLSFYDLVKMLSFVILSIITFTIILERVITPHFILTYSYTVLLIVCFLIAFVCIGVWYLIFKLGSFIFNKIHK